MKFKSGNSELEISDETLISIVKVILRYGLSFTMCLIPFVNDIAALLH
jgi:hypothetical protein